MTLCESVRLALQVEISILEKAKERLRAASPSRFELANKIASERQHQFKQIHEQLDHAHIERERTEISLWRHQAAFAQAELC